MGLIALRRCSNLQRFFQKRHFPGGNVRSVSQLHSIFQNVRSLQSNARFSTDGGPLATVVNDSDTDNKGETPSALAELNNYYKVHHGISSCKIEAEEIGTKSPKWAATLTCPATGRVFKSGTLRDDNVPRQKNSRGRTLYRMKKNAIQAAAACALDVIQFEDLGVVEPRLCEEDPTVGWLTSLEKSTTLENSENLGNGDTVNLKEGSVEDEIVSNGKDKNSTMHVSRLGVTVLHEERLIKLDQSKLEVSPSRKIFGGLAFENADEKEVGEDELIVSHTSRIDGIAPSQRILEAVRNKSAQPKSYKSNSQHSRTLSFRRRIKYAVDMADTWVHENRNRRKNRSRHPYRVFLQHGQFSIDNLPLGESILSVLAEANHGAPLSSMDYGVETVARKILELLWELEETRPGANAYTSMLKCLEGPSAQTIAERGERMVAAMKSGDEWNGRVLPKPNETTMNALIQLWAQVGGQSGRYDTESIDEDFEPNRESFLSLLSSSVYEPEVEDEKVAGFDPVFARQCIQRLEKLADQNPNDKSLRPDTQVYNSPLRWSGGSQWHSSRPYARYIPWDNYGLLFGNGLQALDDGNPHFRDAILMQSWVDEMASKESDLIAPDIETYEALIQGWVRTTSYDGIQRAETIVEKLLSFENTRALPRLQTFHPILAAWLHSNDQSAPSRIEGWIQRLEKLALSHPELTPDGRMFEALVSAQISKQDSILKEVNCDKDCEYQQMTVDELVNAASSCSRVLQRFTDHVERAVVEGRDVTLFMEVSPFARTIQAWQNVAIYGQSTKREELFEEALTEMAQVVESFETVLHSLYVHEMPNGSGKEQDMSQQLAHLITKAHHVFSAFLDGIKDLDEQDKVEGLSENTARCLLPRVMTILEKMIRQVGEFNEIQSPPSSSATLIRAKLFSDDHFDYGLSGRDGNPSRRGFLWQVIDFFKGKSLERGSAGEVVRLCLLIKDIGKARNSKKLVSSVDEFIDHLLFPSQTRQRYRSVPIRRSNRFHAMRRLQGTGSIP